MLNSGQVFKFSSLHINYSLLQFGILTKKGPYANQYLCKLVGIWATSNQACNCDLCMHNFGISMSSFDSTWVTEL